MMLAKKHQENGKDLPTCMFELSQGNNDQVCNEPEYKVEIEQSKTRCHTGLEELVEGLPMCSPPSSSAFSVVKKTQMYGSQ